MAKATDSTFRFVGMEHLLTKYRLMEPLPSQPSGVDLFRCSELTEIDSEVVSREGKDKFMLGLDFSNRVDGIDRPVDRLANANEVRQW